MTFYLKGKRFSLSGLREKDMAEDAPYFRWMNDPALDLHTEHSRFPNHLARHRAYYERNGQGRDLVFMGLYDNASGRHIGSASFKDINWQSQRGHLGYIVGDPEFRRRGVATETMLMFMLYGFQKLNFHRIHTTIAVDNTPSRRVADKIGLIEEGVMRQHIYTAGRRLDVVVYGALRDEWLRSKGEAAGACFAEAPF